MDYKKSYIENLKLPDDTKRHFKEKFFSSKEVHTKIENLNLRINKFINWKLEKKKEKSVLLLTDKNKKITFFIASDLTDYNGLKNFSFWQNKNFSYQSVINKYYRIIEKLPYDKLIKPLELTTKWRLTIGLGIASVYETSITLHHIYGIPYIPGSAVKGVVRSYIIQEFFGREEQDLKNAEKKAMENEAFVNIFGSQKQEGGIIFFDAFPIEAPSIEPDIMNVHYPNYYSGEEPPTDYQNPNPIYFLTVRGKFKFVIAARKGSLNEDKYIFSPPKDYQPQEGNNYVKGTIMWWLYEALSVRGIGAKTAVGYGRMKDSKDK